MHNANLRLEIIRVEQQAKAASLFGNADREPVCSTLRVTPERHPTPGDEPKVPGARPRSRGVPIDERHRKACSKDGVPWREIVVTDRLDRLARLQAPPAAGRGKGRRGIVIGTYERAEMHEHVVTPNIVWETTVEAATVVRDEAGTSADLALNISQNFSPLVVKAQRTRRASKSFTLDVLQQIEDSR
ncbi:hypothetical protein AJ87_43410 [Rhizobium yanglingense]|nr:hypothetical protein AJ87_43410 [Rhizobium yanglingense]